MYAGGYGPEHETIAAFWRVVRAFNKDQRSNLLRFVTSCARPPLLGFKDLRPRFTISNAGVPEEAGGGVRLPSASTCINLLKLPMYANEAILRERLLYAIEANAGFELS